MCFSASASFSAAALLLGIGALTLRSALATRQPRALLFAAIPILFAIQQLIEGVIWLTFTDELDDNAEDRSQALVSAQAHPAALLGLSAAVIFV